MPYLSAYALLLASLLAFASTAVSHAQSDAAVEEIVARHTHALLPPNGAGGVAVAVRINGRTVLFNYGMADLAKRRPVTSDSIFNLASVGKLFAATLLAQAVENDELSLDDRIARYVPELQHGHAIRRVTFGQLASHTSGLPRVPQHYEPWHRGKYPLPDFIRFLNAWRADPAEHGQRHVYSNAGMVLLRIALERRFNTPFAALMRERLTKPLAMNSTALPLPPALRGRAVQGYGPNGRPIGEPGAVQGILDWAGAGQIYSSPHDMAIFLAANLGELSGQEPLQRAMAFAQEGVVAVNSRFSQALAWQVINGPNLSIIDKNGGMSNTSTYIGLVRPQKLGVVILANRGKQPATRVGRLILHELAQESSTPLAEGIDPD